MVESNPIIQGFKGESFLDVGMLLPMYCGDCKGDGCDTCGDEGVVLVRITSVEPESLRTLELNDNVNVEAKLVYDKVTPLTRIPALSKRTLAAMVGPATPGPVQTPTYIGPSIPPVRWRRG